MCRPNLCVFFDRVWAAPAPKLYPVSTALGLFLRSDQDINISSGSQAGSIAFTNYSLNSNGYLFGTRPAFTNTETITLSGLFVNSATNYYDDNNVIIGYINTSHNTNAYLTQQPDPITTLAIGASAPIGVMDILIGTTFGTGAADGSTTYSYSLVDGTNASYAIFNLVATFNDNSNAPIGSITYKWNIPDSGGAATFVSLGIYVPQSSIDLTFTPT